METQGSAQQLVERELPDPKVGRGDLLVRIHAVGFNPVDVKFRTGESPYPFSQVLGCDFSGIVEKVGDLVREFSIGDPVFGLSFAHSSNGSYAELVSLPEAFLAKVPKGLSMEEAASLPVAYLTAYRLIHGKGAFRQGAPLFVAGGGGGVSSAVIEMAQSLGAGPIYTTAGSQESLKYLQDRFSLPKEQILLYKGKAVSEMVKEIKIRFPYTIDCVGGEMTELCAHLADISGHVATILRHNENFPLPVWGTGIFFTHALSLHQVFVLAEAVTPNPTLWKRYGCELRALARLFEEGLLPPPSVEVVGSLSKETVVNAHDRLEKHRTKGKLVMRSRSTRG